MVSKHKHKWQFKEEFQIPVEVIEATKTKYIPLKIMNWFLFPMILYKYYNRFVCECGKEKEVEIRN